MNLVMELIESNIARCNPRPDSCPMFSAKLDWCKIQEDPSFIDTIEVVDKEGFVADKLGDRVKHIDVLIGTDVVYWPNSIKPLVATLNVRLYS